MSFLTKVLFYSINNTWVPHFETELELMSDHLAKGDEVFVLGCRGSLSTCTSNPDKLKTGCLKCTRRCDAGLKKISIKPENIFTLKKSVSVTLPEQFNSIDDLKKFTFDGAALGICVTSSLVSEVRDHKFDTVFYNHKIQKKLYSAVLIYQSCLETFSRVKPDRIYIFNGRFADVYPAVCAAQKLGITFYTHERGGNITTYSLFKNSLPHTALSFMKQEIEELWNVADEKKQAIGAQWFIDRRSGIEQAWVSFSAQQEKKRLPDGFDTTKKNIVIFNSSIDEYDSFPEWADSIYGDEITATKRIVSALEYDSSVHVYFRVHPCLKNLDNTQIKRLKELAAEQHKNLTFIWSAETIDSYALLEYCEKTIVFASTVGVEACYWGKPSILIGRSMYEDVDCCYIPKTHEEVIDLIQKSLSPKKQINAIKYGYWEATRGIIFKKFKPTGLFSGAFLDQEIRPKFGFKDKILLRYYSKLDNVKIKKLAQQKRG